MSSTDSRLPCRFPSCDNPQHARHLCWAHDKQMRRKGTTVPLKAHRTFGPELRALAEELTNAGHGSAEVANLTGLKRSQVHSIRSQMRLRGHSVPYESQGPNEGHVRVEPMCGSLAADLEEASKVERCPRCYLMLPHEGCLPRTATEYASQGFIRAEGGVRDLR
jgi:hypothetical protein